MIYKSMCWEIIKSFYKIFIIKKSKIAIFDVPLLFETMIFKYICFPIVLVYVDSEEEVVRRLKNRDPLMTEEDLRNRLKS